MGLGLSRCRVPRYETVVRRLMLYAFREFNDETPMVEAAAGEPIEAVVLKRVGTAGRGMIDTGVRLDDITEVDSTREDAGLYLEIGTFGTEGGLGKERRIVSDMMGFRW